MPEFAPTPQQRAHESPTVEQLRQELDDLRIEKQQAVQHAMASKEGELTHLRETITAMRDQMEVLRAARDTAAREAVIAAADEIAQLKATVQALRDEMEKHRLRHTEEQQAARVAARRRPADAGDNLGDARRTGEGAWPLNRTRSGRTNAGNSST